MSIYVGRWDCAFCGHTGIHGPLLHCTQCGAHRPEGVVFYLPENPELVERSEEIAAAKLGPDWSCSHCQSHNKMTAKFCGTCGSEYREQDGDQINKEIDYEDGQVPSAGKPVGQSKGALVAPDPKKRPGWKRVGIFGAISAAIAGFLMMFTSEMDVVIIDFQWEATIKLEEYRIVQEEDWQVPAGGKLVGSFQAIHHYDRVFRGYVTRTRTVNVPVGSEEYVCGKRDLGNGYFEDRYCSRTIYDSRNETYQEEVYDEVPRYATKYRYQIWRWLPDKPLQSSGSGQDILWRTKPDLANRNRYKIVGKDSSVHVIIKDHRGEKHKEKLPYTKWKSLKKGGKMKAKKYTFYGSYKELIIDN